MPRREGERSSIVLLCAKTFSLYKAAIIFHERRKKVNERRERETVTLKRLRSSDLT